MQGAVVSLRCIRSARSCRCDCAAVVLRGNSAAWLSCSAVLVLRLHGFLSRCVSAVWSRRRMRRRPSTRQSVQPPWGRATGAIRCGRAALHHRAPRAVAAGRGRRQSVPFAGRRSLRSGVDWAPHPDRRAAWLWGPGQTSGEIQRQACSRRSYITGAAGERWAVQRWPADRSRIVAATA